MTIEQLAAHNDADRLRVLNAAIADTYRGIDRLGDAGAHSRAAHERNLVRLKAERAALVARMGHAS